LEENVGEWKKFLRARIKEGVKSWKCRKNELIPLKTKKGPPEKESKGF